MDFRKLISKIQLFTVKMSFINHFLQIDFFQIERFLATTILRSL